MRECPAVPIDRARAIPERGLGHDHSDDGLHCETALARASLRRCAGRPASDLTLPQKICGACSVVSHPKSRATRCIAQSLAMQRQPDDESIFIDRAVNAHPAAVRLSDRSDDRQP